MLYNLFQLVKPIPGVEDYIPIINQIPNQKETIPQAHFTNLILRPGIEIALTILPSFVFMLLSPQHTISMERAIKTTPAIVVICSFF
jgi:hypothetical protein